MPTTSPTLQSPDSKFRTFDMIRSKCHGHGLKIENERKQTLLDTPAVLIKKISPIKKTLIFKTKCIKFELVISPWRDLSGKNLTGFGVPPEKQPSLFTPTCPGKRGFKMPAFSEKE